MTSSEPCASQHPLGRLALLSDPFGHGFCLFELQGRGYDELLPAAIRHDVADCPDLDEPIAST